VVVGGDGGAVVKTGGISGWFQAQMEKAQAVQANAAAGPAPREAEPEEEAPKAAAKNGRGGNGRAQVIPRGSKRAAAGDDRHDGDEDGDAGDDAPTSGTAVIVPRKGKR
jgi:hypothetical protein